MLFSNVLTQPHDAVSSVVISIMTQLRNIFSFALMHITKGKKKTKTIKNISS